MKILLYIFSLIALFSCQNKPKKVDSDLQNIEQSTSIQKPKKEVKKVDLEKVDYKSYCGKTLGELLENETLKSYKSHLITDEPPFKLSSVEFTYSNSNKSLSVYFGDLVYQKKFNSNINWSFDLLKKEKFEFIAISKDGVYDRPIFTYDCIDRTKEKF